MATQLPTPIVLLLAGYLLSAAVTVGIAVYVLRYRRTEPSARAFAALSLSLAVWALGFTGRVLSTTVPGKLAWNQFAYVGIVAVPTTWLVFVLLYTGKHQWVSRRVLGLLAVVPLVTLAFLYTNPVHHLFYESVTLSLATGWPIISSAGVGWYWVHVVYSYALFLFGVLLLVRFAIDAPQPYRRQAISITATFMFIWVVNLAFVVDVDPYPHVDLTPVTFGLGFVPLAAAIFRVRFIDLVPVARETVVDAVDTPIFVVDDRGRVADANAAASELVGSSDAVLGQPATDVLPEALVTTGVLQGDVDADLEFATVVDDRERWYWVRQLPIGRPVEERGAVLVLTDVTSRKRQREQLEQQNEQLESLADVVSHDLRNPLDVGRGYVQLLGDVVVTLPDDDRAAMEEQLGKLRDTHDRIDQISHDLVRLAQQGKPIDVADLVSVEEVARDAWETVETGAFELIVEGSRIVEADESRLRQAFENLFRNSVEHSSTDRRTPSDDTVEHGSTSSRSQAHENSVEHSSTDRRTPSDDAVEHGSPGGDGASGDFVRSAAEDSESASGSGDCGTVWVGASENGFYVEDDGPGIPAGARRRVFEYGYSTRSEGSGLGLAIVEEVTAAHGWAVAVVEGRVGGARFEVDTR